MTEPLLTQNQQDPIEPETLKWPGLGHWTVVGLMMFAAWAVGFAQPGLQDLGVVIFLIVILFPLFRFVAWPLLRHFLPPKSHRS